MIEALITNFPAYPQQPVGDRHRQLVLFERPERDYSTP